MSLYTVGLRVYDFCLFSNLWKRGRPNSGAGTNTPCPLQMLLDLTVPCCVPLTISVKYSRTRTYFLVLWEGVNLFIFFQEAQQILQGVYKIWEFFYLFKNTCKPFLHDTVEYLSEVKVLDQDNLPVLWI